MRVFSQAGSKKGFQGDDGFAVLALVFIRCVILLGACLGLTTDGIAEKPGRQVKQKSRPGASNHRATANRDKADRAEAAAQNRGLKVVDISVDGVSRRAFVHRPSNASTGSVPLVFIFHGHGGNGLQAAQKMPMHRHMPGALCVYPQGLNTVTKGDPAGKKTGWQQKAGDYNDRDLKFFDSLLLQIKHDYRIDPARIYCTGHSNGGAFTFLLWATRANVFAAVAPTSAAPVHLIPQLSPKPAIYAGGTGDTIVPFPDQLKMIAASRRVNRCRDEGTGWNDHAKIYSSEVNAPFVEYIYRGGHSLPDDATSLVARFFRQFPRSSSP